MPTAVPTIVPGIELPPITLPPIPQVPLTPEQAAALIPTELLQSIQSIVFGGKANGGAAPAPPCRKQGLVRVRR